MKSQLIINFIFEFDKNRLVSISSLNVAEITRSFCDKAWCQDWSGTWKTPSFTFRTVVAPISEEAMVQQQWMLACFLCCDDEPAGRWSRSLWGW